MNKDESEKCYERAKTYYASGDYENALKFFNKSQKLDASEVTARYIKNCEEKIQRGQSKPQSNGSSQQKSQKEGNKKNVAATTSSSSQSNEPVPDDIKKILAQKDFYELLGVSKTSTDDEIKKSYRKLALKYHPDKNQAPKADEAFKKIAQAYDCLSNPEKKRKYDEFGNEEPEQHFQHYRRYYSDEVSPDDIFNMFFGGNMAQHMGGHGGARTFTFSFGGGGPMFQQFNGRQTRRTQSQEKNSASPLMQFLPLIFLFGLSYLFRYAQDPEPTYAFAQSYRFPIAKRTHELGYTYYVDNAFQSNTGRYPDKLKELETEIESKTIVKLQESCSLAQSTKKQLENRAQYYQGAQREGFMNRASSIDLSSCESVEHARKVKPVLFKGSSY